MPLHPDPPGRFDIVVAGGGVIGAAGAIRLARSGARVALVDAGPAESEARETRPGERLVARTCLALEALDIPTLETGVPARATISTWLGGSPSQAEPVWPPARLIDRCALDAGALAAASKAGVHVITERRVSGLSGTPGHWTLAVGNSGEAPLQAAFLVDATGRRASLARTLGPARLECDRLVGMVRRWRNGPDEAGMFLLEPVDDGWLYAVGMAGGLGLVGWMSFSDLLRGRGTRALDQALTRSRLIGPHLHSIREWTQDALYPSGPGRLETACGAGWAALGDAALHTDPIEGQGIARGLDMVEALTELVTASPENARHCATGYTAWLAACLETHLTERLALYQEAPDLSDAFLSRLARPGSHATTALSPGVDRVWRRVVSAGPG